MTNDHTAEFLKVLYGDFESGYLYLWTLPDRITWCFSVSELQTMITAAKAIQDERDVYFGIGSSVQKLEPKERVKPKDVACLPGLWMDMDVLAPGAHVQKALPATPEEALAIFPDFLQPSMVVWSGYGLHLYWLFREPWQLESPEENSQAADLEIRLQAYIKFLAGERGWVLDSTADLSRVMRVPGTLNHKLQPARPVHILKMDPVRYDPSELTDNIPEIDFKTQLTNHGAFERRQTDARSDLMISSCQFLQHCILDAKKITYGEWLSMLTNVVRGVDGIEKCHEISRHDPDRYRPKDTDFKLTEALKMNPHTCQYIKATHGFPCPERGCGVKSPCSFSLSRVDQARARVNMIGIPSSEKVYTEEMLDALSIVKTQDAALYAKTKEKFKGTINLRDLERSLKQRSQTAANSEIEIPDIGEEITDAPIPGIRYPAGFTVTENGINYVKLTDNGPRYYRACGCPTIISARLYNQDTDTESLKISYKHMGYWRDIVVSRSTAVSDRKIITLADKGLAVSSEGAKYLAKYFDEFLYCNPHIPVQKAVSRFGWRGKDYVFPGLSPEIEIDVDDMGTKHALKGFKTAGSSSDWVHVANMVRNSSPNARFILAAGFAAPLLKLLSQRNFIIHNHGNSQDGKTATLWLAMSIWGDPEVIISSFDNTATSLERRASLFSDLPLGINEREVLSQLKKQDLSATLYMLGEGKGRGRGGKTGLQELNTWRTIVLTTGEGPLTTNSSLDGLMTRTIELEGGPLAGNKDLARYLYGFLPGCHGHAGIAFLNNLVAAQRGDIVDFYHRAQGWLRQYYGSKIDSHLDALATVMTADWCSSAWVFNIEWSIACGQAYDMGATIGEKLISRLEASESERAWLEFMDWVGENHERLSSVYTNVKIGTKENGWIYVIRRVVNEFLADYSSAQKIIRAWADTGKIRMWTDSAGKQRFDIQRKMGGAVVRCIAFEEDTDNLFNSKVN